MTDQTGQTGTGGVEPPRTLEAALELLQAATPPALAPAERAALTRLLALCAAYLPPADREELRRAVMGAKLCRAGAFDDEVSACRHAGRAAIATTGGGRADCLPTIVITDRDLPDISGEAAAHLARANDPPELFRREGSLVRVASEDGAVRVEPVTDAILRGYLARAAHWRRRAPNGSQEAAWTPRTVVQDVAVQPDVDLPILRGLARSPVLRPDGTLAAAAGYDPATRLWLDLSDCPPIPPVPPSPSAADIAAARNLLVSEWLGDFPFVDEASRAHALAALVEPFVRPVIAGPLPLHAIDAPAPGTGKTWLVDVLSIVATGQQPLTLTEADNEEEWRKRIAAALAGSPTMLLIDNIRRRLVTGALASALTAWPRWRDRLLGRNDAVLLVPVLCSWFATGNKLNVDQELARRSVLTRLDAGVEKPHKRTGFRHTPLHAWTGESRGRLMGAVLTFVQAWAAAGRPPGSGTLGSYEEWIRVVGGILDVAGVPGFLANADAFYERADEHEVEWRAFVGVWLDRHGEDSVRTGELRTLAEESELLGAQLGDGSERSQSTRLGNALRQREDRVYGGHRIQRDGTGKRKVGRWRLAPAAPPEPGAVRTSRGPDADLADEGPRRGGQE